MSLTSSLEKIENQVSVLEYLDYRLYLNSIYLIAKSNSKRYSYLQFSEDLGFSKTNVVHLIIKGKRPLSLKASEKIVKALNLTGIQKKYFSTLISYQNARQPEKRERLFKELIQIKAKAITTPETQSQLEFFSEWFHIIIYQMTFMDDFIDDPQHIAKSVVPNIRPDQARKSIQLLKSLDLISVDDNTGKVAPTKTRVSTGDEIASIAVTRYHHKMIELGKESITKISEHERDISSISISIPLAMIPELKEEISIFRKKILALADQKRNQCDEVYQMNIQLFPTTQLKKKGGKS